MARRPFDPAAHGLDQNRVPAGRHPRPRRRRRAGRRRRHRRPPRLHHHGFARGERPGQPGGNPQRVRGDGGGPAPRRLVYTSSVAAYGYHSDNPVPITEDVPTRGSPEHYYSEQKAACEAALTEITAAHRSKCSSCGRASSRGRRRPRSPRPCRGTSFPARFARCRRPCPCSSRRSPIRARRCSSCTTTTSPPRSPWPQPLPRLLGPTTSPVTGVLSMSDVAEALGARPVPVPRTRGVGGLGGHGPAAVRAVGAGVAARRADVGGDGHRQGEVPAGLDTEIHRGRDVVGVGGVALATACGPRCRPGRSGWPRPRRTSRHRRLRLWPGRSPHRRRRPGGPASDFRGLGLFLVHRHGLPGEPVAHSVGPAAQLVCPVVGHTACVARARSHPWGGKPAPRVRGRRSTRWSGSSRTSPRRVRTTG